LRQRALESHGIPHLAMRMIMEYGSVVWIPILNSEQIMTNREKKKTSMALCN
jgi:hypothetical protein